MFRRRSRGHYDPQQYNTGVPTRSASLSASAAANAFYQRQLGPSAAAEALRRHSLDQTGANEMRDFQLNGTPSYQPAPTQPSYRLGGGRGSRTNSLTRANSLGRSNSLSRTNSLSGSAPSGAPRGAQAATGTTPRRANSLTTRSYQVYYHNQPAPQPSPPRALWTPSGPRRVPSYNSPGISRSIQPVNRRNSLTGGERSNSLTRTHTVVNRDSQGRTMSLTTTTVRQMGSFELVSTKDIPIASPSRLARPQPSFANDFDAPSVHSLDSELGGIQEEPEESVEEMHNRLTRLGDPISEADESIDFGLAKPAEIPQSPAAPRDHADEDKEVDRSKTATPEFDESKYSDSTVSDMTTSPRSDRASDPSPSQIRTAAATHIPPVPEAMAEPKETHEQARDSREAVTSASLADPPAGAATEPTLDTPKQDGPSHRGVSPVRSALRNSTGNSGQKTRVSFGGADKPYVYESYEYEDDPPAAPAVPGIAPSPHLAAAAAAARNRPLSQIQPHQPSAYLQQYQQTQQSQLQQRRPFVISQPTHNVQKRPSTSSMTGRASSTTAPARPAQLQAPYPHARPWDENFADAASSFNEPPVPARSAARPTSSPILESQPQFAPPANAHQLESDEEEKAHAQIHAQALALAQAQYNNQNGGPNAASPGGLGIGNSSMANGGMSTGGGHLYRGLVDDDAASTRSDSSFTRETSRRGGGMSSGPPMSKQTGGTQPSRMRSLRQPATPSLRGNNSKPGRKSSLLNQAPPQLDMTPIGGSATPRGDSHGKAGGFRTFSLRNTNRPDPATLLAGQPSSPSAAAPGLSGSAANGNPTSNFTSRFADSDSEDESGGGGFFRKSTKKQNASGKMTFGDVFSPNTDVKDLFKSNRSASDGAVMAEQKPRTKKGGFFKRVFGKKE